MRDDGFTDRQLEQLGKILEVALVPIKQDIAELKRDVVEIKQDIVEIKQDLNEVRELPIIKEALKKSKDK